MLKQSLRVAQLKKNPEVIKLNSLSYLSNTAIFIQSLQTLANASPRKLVIPDQIEAVAAIELGRIILL